MLSDISLKIESDHRRFSVDRPTSVSFHDKNSLMLARYAVLAEFNEYAYK